MRHRQARAPSESSKLRRVALDSELTTGFSQNGGTTADESGVDLLDCLWVIAHGGVVQSVKLGYEWRRIVRGTTLDGDIVELAVVADHFSKRLVILNCKTLEKLNDDQADAACGGGSTEGPTGDPDGSSGSAA